MTTAPIANFNVNVDDIPLSSILEPSSLATYRKNVVFHDVIKDFSVKDKRRVFADMRNSSISVGVNTLFPRYGFTSGEFSTWTVLTENNRKKR
jgi:hypothetical protein